MGSIRDSVDSIIEEVTEIRRDIHRHPEIGRKEVRTAGIIRDKLREYGVDEILTPMPTGTVAIIKGAKGPGKCVALRTDIDALPLQEDTDLPFASEVPNMMHACGHDIHASMMLGVAKVLCDSRDRFAGTVKLIFQPSEDTLPGGAKEMVECGVMENPKVDAIFAMHVMPDPDIVGKIAIKAGPMTTSVDLYDVTITGKGGHGSEPHTTQDPILAAAQMILDMQQIVARKIDPLDTGIVSLGSIHSGDAPNVIPAQCKFGGVSRAYSESARKKICEQMYKIAEGIKHISDCDVDIYHYEGYPSVLNDAKMVKCVEDAVSEELGPDAIVELEKPFSFSEDFSYFGNMTGVPSALFMVYAGQGTEEAYPLHSPKIIFKEEAMPYGIRAMAATALNFLNGDY